MRRLLGALLALVLFASPAIAKEIEVFTIDDERITQSSGLVDLGDLMVTVNSAGDRGILYVLDDTGAVVGTTDFGPAVDVEALAPAGGADVWAGDVGDNRKKRTNITVFKVPIEQGDQSVEAPSYQLTYPDGAHDAETLLADPRTQRLYVVTLGRRESKVYAAPQALAKSNTLEQVATVPLVPTDGAVLPDGKHVILRDYSMGYLFTFPDFSPLGTFVLPGQAQGEGLSIGPQRRVRLSSEGIGQPVMETKIPKKAFIATSTPSPSPSATPTPTPAAGTTAARADSASPMWMKAVAGVALIAGAGALLWALAGFRQRRRISRQRVTRQGGSRAGLSQDSIEANTDEADLAVERNVDE